MSNIEVKVKKVRENAVIPAQATNGAAGFDLTVAAILDENGNEMNCETMVLNGNFTTKIKCATGLAMEIPEGYCMKILPRSGMACNEDITVTNAPGLIDNDYRGEIIVCLTKHHTHFSKDSYISVGDRVAQATIEKIELPAFVEVDELSETERGVGGFNSTGK